MKKILLYAMAMVTILALSVGMACALPCSYDSDNQGWQQTYVGRPGSSDAYDILYSNTAADWTGTEGNPPGSIYQVANDNIDKRAYWLGYISDESNFLGDLHGLQLQTDIYSTRNWQTVFGNDVYARWVISRRLDTGYYNMFVSKSFASIDINSFNGWETHMIAMEENNFLRWPNYTDSSYSFNELLSDYDSIGLYIFSSTDNINNIDGHAGTWDSNSRLLHYGAYSNNGEDAIWGLDNFQAVPEPSTILFMGIGILGLAGYFRGKRG